MAAIEEGRVGNGQLLKRVPCSLNRVERERERRGKRKGKESGRAAAATIAIPG
jgi:hypothetical protein